MSTLKPIGTTLDTKTMLNSDYSLPVSQAAVVQRRVASGQITITDLNDGRMIQAYTVASLGDTQVYNPDTKQYTPDYTAIGEGGTAEPQLVTAKVFMSGNGSDLATTPACTDWEWTVNGLTELPVWATVDTATAPHTLAINRNIAPADGLLDVRWRCRCKDPDTLATVIVEGGKTLSLVKSSGATGLVVIELPYGNTFSTGGRETLSAKARLMRGSTHDKTVSAAKWEALDISDGQWKEVTNGVSELSEGVSELTVTPSDVLNFQTYRCTVTDTETKEDFINMVTFLDASDPYMVELYTLTGDVIKNGEGSTTVYARLWRGGEIVEDGQSVLYNYGFSKFDSKGNATAWSDTTDTILDNVIKFGNPVVVKAADINGKATFYCNVTRKL